MLERVCFCTFTEQYILYTLGTLGNRMALPKFFFVIDLLTELVPINLFSLYLSHGCLYFCSLIQSVDDGNVLA